MRPCLLIPFVVSLIALGGCAGLERAGTAAVTPNPETGQPPLWDFFSGVLEVVVNPGSLTAWGKILGAVAVVIAAGFGVKKVHAVRKARKAAQK